MGVSEIIVHMGLGILIADVVSGVVHWFEDTYGDPKWPILGKHVIAPNIAHHEDPLRFARNTYWRRNRPVIALTLVLGAAFAAFGWLNLIGVTALAVGSQANELHRFAHLPPQETPRWVRALQHVGLMQSAQHHWRHHSRGFNTHYCAVTNFANPILDGLHVFRLVEGVIEGLFKIRPRYDREAYYQPTLGRRWIPRPRRKAHAAVRTLSRKLAPPCGRFSLAA